MRNKCKTNKVMGYLSAPFTNKLGVSGGGEEETGLAGKVVKYAMFFIGLVLVVGVIVFALPQAKTLITNIQTKITELINLVP